MKRIFIYPLLFLIIAFLLCRLLINLSSKQPDRIGLHFDCPNSPNCVSSTSVDDDHAIEPLLFEGDPLVAQDQLIKAINSIQRTTVESTKPTYVHATIRSSIWGFVDDMEFMVGDGRIDMRSASRMGYSDMGANRTLIEKIRIHFSQLVDE